MFFWDSVERRTVGSLRGGTVYVHGAISLSLGIIYCD